MDKKEILKILWKAIDHYSLKNDIECYLEIWMDYTEEQINDFF
jgi:hypothetical protein